MRLIQNQCSVHYANMTLEVMGITDGALYTLPPADFQLSRQQDTLLVDQPT